MQFENTSLDKYDAVMKELGLKLDSNSNWPEEILSHTAGSAGSTLVVVDVWESEAGFSKYRETRLGPAFCEGRWDARAEDHEVPGPQSLPALTRRMFVPRCDLLPT